MKAEDFKEGKQFRNIHTNEIMAVVIDKDTGNKLFEETEYGDTYLYLDEDNFIEI